MCHNKETSLVIFIFAISVIIHFILEYTKTKDIKYIFLSMYILGLASMQLVEFFIHYYNNTLASWSVLFAIVFQFILAAIYIHYDKIFPVETCVLDIVFYLAIVILICMIINKPVKDSINCDHPYLWLGCKLNWGITENMLKASTFLTYIAMAIYTVYMCTATYELFQPVIFGIFMSVYFITTICPKIIDIYRGKQKVTNFHGSSSGWCFFLIILTSLIIILDEPSVIK